MLTWRAKAINDLAHTELLYVEFVSHSSLNFRQVASFIFEFSVVQAVEVAAESSIRFSAFCNHDVVCYCAMLDYAATMATPNILVTADDKACAACALGPETGATTTAKSCRRSTRLVGRCVSE